jgi:hypothetical protein
MSEATVKLNNVLNPVMFFHKHFLEYIVRPAQELQRRMRDENYAKELKIIKQLDAERQHAWYAYDIKWRLLAAA